MLVLLYRLCYFLDHRELKAGELRYAPQKELSDCIDKIDFSLKEGFKDKYKKDTLGVFDYLLFIDLLGWNEDVKYHVRRSRPDFKDRAKKNVGRVNTIMSVISVPLMVNDFLHNIIENVDCIEKINVRLILSTMQRLTKSRGICVLSGKELLTYLTPYLVFGE